jgi:hypothetical protein
MDLISSTDTPEFLQFDKLSTNFVTKMDAVVEELQYAYPFGVKEFYSTFGQIEVPDKSNLETVSELSKLITARTKSILKATSIVVTQGGDKKFEKSTNMEKYDGTIITEMVSSADESSTDPENTLSRRSNYSQTKTVDTPMEILFSCKVLFTKDMLTKYYNHLDGKSGIIDASHEIEVPAFLTDEDVRYGKVMTIVALNTGTNLDYFRDFEYLDKIYKPGEFGILKPMISDIEPTKMYSGKINPEGYEERVINDMNPYTIVIDDGNSEA